MFMICKLFRSMERFAAQANVKSFDNSPLRSFSTNRLLVARAG
jgi:hypothetical protein